MSPIQTLYFDVTPASSLPVIIVPPGTHALSLWTALFPPNYVIFHTYTTHHTHFLQTLRGELTLIYAFLLQ